MFVIDKSDYLNDNLKSEFQVALKYGGCLNCLKKYLNKKLLEIRYLYLNV